MLSWAPGSGVSGLESARWQRGQVALAAPCGGHALSRSRTPGLMRRTPGLPQVFWPIDNESYRCLTLLGPRWVPSVRQSTHVPRRAGGPGLFFVVSTVFPAVHAPTGQCQRGSAAALLIRLAATATTLQRAGGRVPARGQVQAQDYVRHRGAGQGEQGQQRCSVPPWHGASRRQMLRSSIIPAAISHVVGQGIVSLLESFAFSSRTSDC